jgi:hypothetical protein
MIAIVITSKNKLVSIGSLCNEKVRLGGGRLWSEELLQHMAVGRLDLLVVSRKGLHDLEAKALVEIDGGLVVGLHVEIDLLDLREASGRLVHDLTVVRRIWDHENARAACCCSSRERAEEASSRGQQNDKL